MKRILKITILLLLLTLFPAAALGQQEETDALVASGNIEAEMLTIAAETGGRVTGIFAVEGDEVDAGTLLIELDDTTLNAQRDELLAAVNTAAANLAEVQAGPREERIAAAEAQLRQAETQSEGLYQTWQSALALVDNPQPLLSSIRQAEAAVKQAQGQIDLAETEIKTAQINAEAASRDQSSHAALVTYDMMRKQLAAAQTGKAIAEANVATAKLQLAHLWEMYTNPIPFQVQANQAHAAYQIARAGVALAEANLAAAETGATPEAIAVAQAQLGAAESALALYDVQAAKLTLTAPRYGIISKQAIQPGEVAGPGATLMTLTDLDEVTLKVYIPETELGNIKVGQPANVTVDSLPDVFNGTVTYIADQAEFTPKNVQTKEERVNLVFAVEISIPNPDHKLKPGMPADAEFIAQ